MHCCSEAYALARLSSGKSCVLIVMNVGAMVFYRFSFAVLGLCPLLFTHPVRLSRREWLSLSLASLLGVPLQFLLQFYGLSLTTVSHASLMVGSMPESPRFSQEEMLRCFNTGAHGESARVVKVRLLSSSSSSRSK